MAVLKVRGKNTYYTVRVTVPYHKTGEGEVTFYLEYLPKTKTWLTVHIDGFHYDDDLPDLYFEAVGVANETAFHVPSGYCPECGGEGEVVIANLPISDEPYRQETCPVCEGEGKV